MKERPILFSAPMVRAILEGRKTQTRRGLDRMAGFKVRHFDKSDTPGYDWHFRCQRGLWQDMRNDEVLSRCPYGQIGDRLWVRETWLLLTGEPGPITCSYRADHGKTEFAGLWKPSIHMPRWASRITLEITGVRVERLNEISDEDAIAEGIGLDAATDHPRGVAYTAFRSLWESINGAGSWAWNPWVWVVEFKRLNGGEA